MNHYELLEIRENASSEVIEMAYKALIRKYHPDVYRDDPEFAHNITQQINEAHKVLTNPEEKTAYDNLLAAEREKINLKFQTKAEKYAFQNNKTLPFRPPSNLTRTHMALLAVCAILICVCGFLILRNSTVETERLTLEAGMTNIKSTLKDVENNNLNLQTANKNLNENLRFYYENACIVSNRSRVYHHYGCPYINDGDSYILDVSNAKRLGYVPCPYCWKDSYDDFYHRDIEAVRKRPYDTEIKKQ